MVVARPCRSRIFRKRLAQRRGSLESVLSDFARRLREARRVASSYLATPVAARATKLGASHLVVGRAEPDEGHVLLSPFTKQAVVFWQVEVEKYEREGGRGAWKDVMRDTSNSMFWLVDDRGDRIFVNPAHSVAQLPLADVSDHPLLANDRELQLRLARVGYATSDGVYAFYERIVPAHTGVAVYGVVDDEQTNAPTKGYRGAVARGLRMIGTEREPLVIRRR
jgi:hypothetical protein